MSDDGKTTVVTSLLSAKSKEDNIIKPPRIEIIGEKQVQVEAPTNVEEGPTLMEMMMAAQQEAKKEKDAIVKLEKEKQNKGFGGGFKKGFLSSGTTSNPKSQSEPKKGTKKISVVSNSDIPTIKAQDKKDP